MPPYFAPNSISKNPNIAETEYRIIMIRMFSFFDLFVLSKTARPIPAPEQSPATHEPRLSAPDTYSSVSKTEIAQFGTSPINAVIKG